MKAEKILLSPRMSLNLPMAFTSVPISEKKYHKSQLVQPRASHPEYSLQTSLYVIDRDHPAAFYLLKFLGVDVHGCARPNYLPQRAFSLLDPKFAEYFRVQTSVGKQSCG